MWPSKLRPASPTKVGDRILEPQHPLGLFSKNFCPSSRQFTIDFTEQNKVHTFAKLVTKNKFAYLPATSQATSQKVAQR